MPSVKQIWQTFQSYFILYDPNMQTNQQTRICFVRHGETDWNAERRMQGHIYITLNAAGLN